jgi:hypothetical protein
MIDNTIDTMFNNKTYFDSLEDIKDIEDIEEMDVSDKGIKNLDVRRFKNLKILICSNNKLTSLQLTEKLETLNCSENQLTSLQLTEKLETLNCSDNQFIYLHLNENLETLDYAYNPIYEIIGDDDIDTIKQKIRVLNQFRHLYYSLKFKKQFRHWLWVRVREPKIRMKYHPDYLLKSLCDKDTDFDELLNNW